jgi:hypothetical protein
MVKVFDKDGTLLFHEPPYTWEEEQEFYRRIGGGPKVILHAPAPAPVPSAVIRLLPCCRVSDGRCPGPECWARRVGPPVPQFVLGMSS